MQKKTNLQDLFLLRIRQDRLPVTLFLMNGFQMRGIVPGYDPFVVVLDSDGRQQSPPLYPSGRWNCGKRRRVPHCNTYEAL